MTKQPFFRPLSEDIRRGRPADHLVRALLASGLAQYERGGAEAIARRLWPTDEAPRVIMKAASAPADTSTSGWASQLAQASIADLVMTLGPISCAGELMRLGMALEFGRSATISVPSIVSAALGSSAWIEQGAPIPVRALSIGAGATLTPKKTAGIFTVTRELLEHSTPNAEQFIRAAATESIGAEIDSAMFDDAAASSTRPAGLRNGVSVTAATAGGGDSALMKDLGALAQAVSAVGGLNIAYVAAPDAAVKIPPPPQFRFPVFASGGLASGMVMCVALPALASAIDPAVRFSVDAETLLHMDTSPSAIGTVGTPNVIASPARSLFQTDCVAFKLLIEVSWGLRGTGAISWTENITW